MKKIFCREELEFSFLQIRRASSKLYLSPLQILFELFELLLSWNLFFSLGQACPEQGWFQIIALY